MLEGDRWLVIDNLQANESHHYGLHWLLCDSEYGMQKLASSNGLWFMPTKTDSLLSDSKCMIQLGSVNGEGDFSVVRADPNSTRGWRSQYYGHKAPAISVMLEVNRPKATLWSFFGFENDVVELHGTTLKINSNAIPLVE